MSVSGGVAAVFRVPIRNVFGKLILSPTLASNELVKSHPNPENIVHLGFGQSPFPVHESLKSTKVGFGENHYENTSGSTNLTQAVRKFYEKQHNVDLSYHDIIMCPGSKLGLFALQLSIEGSTMLPIPSWVSYEPQMRMLGISAIKFKADLSDNGMRLDPVVMQAKFDEAIANGLPRPTKMIINSPNNPTGLIISNMEEVAKFVEDNNIVLISDEIYDGVTKDGKWSSFLPLATNNTIVTTGLSKAFSLGGWRIGALLVPKSMEGVADTLRVVASETWSSVPSPMQTASIQAYNTDNKELAQHIIDCSNIHHLIGTWFSNELVNYGINCPRYQGAFYLYPNFDKFRITLAREGVCTSDEFATYLAKEYGIVALPATAFGDNDTMSVRLALCDFNGEKMLKAYISNGRSLGVDDIKRLAPRLQKATKEFERMCVTLNKE
eukprot:m.7609 g.7609  ORF g.7609 m.7609 type:complete len:438 (-) comp2871_c0_seq1:252-1565(-)